MQQQVAGAPVAAANTAKGAAQGTATAKGGEKKEEKKGALANAVQARTPEEQANQSGFQFFASLDHWLGSGTFVDPTMYSYLAAQLSIQGVYLFGIKGKRFAATLTGRVTFEYTMPDNNSARRVDTADTRLGLSAPAIFRTPKFGPFSGLALTPSLGLFVPTSLASFNNGMIANLGVGLAATTRVKMFDLRVNVGGSRGFFTRTQSGAVLPRDGNGLLQRDSSGNQVGILRPGEGFLPAGNNTSWSANIGGSVQFRATDSLMFYASYTYVYAWRFDVNSTNEADQFTSSRLDSNGNPVAENGAGRFDRTMASFGLSYQLNEHYSLDFGVSTIQLPLININGTWQPRFPFLSVGTWADNSTTAYFTLTAAY